jgi:hypothetical protein
MRLLDVSGGKSQLAATGRTGRLRYPHFPGARVMRLVCEGMYTRKSPIVLSISIKTVEHHRASILRKLGLQKYR